MIPREDEYWAIVKDRVKFFSTQVGCILIDSCFVGIWAIIDQLYHEYVIEFLKSRFHSTFVLEYVFPIMKWVFDIVTFGIVLIFLYTDFKRIAKRTIDITREGAQRKVITAAESSKELITATDLLELEETNEANARINK